MSLLVAVLENSFLSRFPSFRRFAEDISCFIPLWAHTRIGYFYLRVTDGADGQFDGGEKKEEAIVNRKTN